jgi:hypothetical protein
MNYQATFRHPNRAQNGKLPAFARNDNTSLPEKPGRQTLACQSARDVGEWDGMGERVRGEKAS